MPNSRVDVLLIEDNPTDVLLAQESLCVDGRFAISHVERLSKGVALLNAGAFDIVLLDLGLPDSQGLDTLLKLRQSSPLIPVVVMTGGDDEDLALRAVHLGAQDYLVKSTADAGTLRRSIRYAIERNQSAEALRKRAILASMNADIGLAFTTGGPASSTLRSCAESMVAGLEASLVRIWTVGSSGDLVMQGCAGDEASAALPEAYERAPIVGVDAVAAARTPLFVADIADALGEAGTAWIAEAGLRSYLGLPLLIGDRLVGVISVFAREPLSQPQFEAATSIANLIALGIERDRTEQSLREVNRTLNSLVSAAPVAIVLLDAAGLVIGWNASAERLFGWSASEVVGRPFPALFEAEDPELPRMLRDTRFDGQIAGREIRPRRKDGSSVDVSLWTASIRDDGGTPVASIGIFADNSQRKQLEDQLRQAQKMEAIGSLAGGIAHDFNNLLTIIGGCGELLRRRLVDAGSDTNVLDLAAEIIRAGERAAALTRQLLAFSRKQVLEPKVLNLNDLVRNLEKLLDRLIGEDVDLAATLDSELGNVRADAGQLEQVVMNLAVNARDAMPHGGVLSVETRNVDLNEDSVVALPELSPGPYVTLVVTDSGLGMDEATRSRIFEPFFTTKGIGSGTGLGLATVYGIVKQSGGHIHVTSAPNEGSVFVVYLPRVTLDVPETQAAAPAVAVHGTETVLLVEDDRALRNLARRILELNGYTVLEAVNGEDALRIAGEASAPVHLLVTDVVMPVMGGTELAERLTAERPGLRVLYLSGYTDDAVVQRGVLQLDTAFLHKPFTPSALAQKVRQVLDQ